MRRKVFIIASLVLLLCTLTGCGGTRIQDKILKYYKTNYSDIDDANVVPTIKISDITDF